MHNHGSADDGHGLAGGWETWGSQRTLRVIVAFVIAAGLATIAAVVMLWPSGTGQSEATERAQTLGLASDRLAASVQAVTDQPCGYSSTVSPQACRTVTLQLDEGPEAGSVVVLPDFNLEAGFAVPQVSVGERVIVGYEPATNTYFFADTDRRSVLVVLAVLFAVVVIALGRLRGGLALAAMASTIVVLVGFVAPSVLDGNDPLLVAVVAASAIAFISLYLTHGFGPTTTVALAGTLAALGLTLGLSYAFFELANFTGLASEEGFTLPFIARDIDLASLLLGGAVLGALGALDDVTVTQVATVAELHRRSPALTTKELVASGVRVGREHIASAVNTLLLAYAGASMPILLILAASDQSLAMAANSEVVAIEIVRTLCGSIGLVAAVPITTALAAIVVNRSTMPSDAHREVAIDNASVNPTTWDDFGPRDASF